MRLREEAPDVGLRRRRPFTRRLIEFGPVARWPPQVFRVRALESKQWAGSRRSRRSDPDRARPPPGRADYGTGNFVCLFARRQRRRRPDPGRRPYLRATAARMQAAASAWHRRPVLSLNLPDELAAEPRASVGRPGGGKLGLILAAGGARAARRQQVINCLKCALKTIKWIRTGARVRLAERINE